MNSYDQDNEGFLSYLWVVGNQTNPPLVHSLSYGDVEASVFDPSNPGSASYGYRCDEEFLAMGLRGLTILFSSGDDGSASYIIRTDPTLACSQAWYDVFNYYQYYYYFYLLQLFFYYRPTWPASSPYVTTIGGTQLTDKYLPVCQCEHQYDYPYLPTEKKLDFQCSGVAETVCSSV